MPRNHFSRPKRGKEGNPTDLCAEEMDRDEMQMQMLLPISVMEGVLYNPKQQVNGKRKARAGKRRSSQS